MNAEPDETAQPPVPLPPYLSTASARRVRAGVWLVYDSTTSTMGFLNCLAGTDGAWTLYVPVPEDVFARILRDAEIGVTALMQGLAVAGPAANTRPV